MSYKAGAVSEEDDEVTIRHQCHVDEVTDVVHMYWCDCEECDDDSDSSGEDEIMLE